MNRRPSRRSRSRGQALPEFALVVPILALILLGILQIGFILAAQVGITNAVREAARLAATTTPTSTNAQASTNGAGVYDALTNASTGFLKRNVMAYSSANLVTSGSPVTDVCYSTFTDAAGKFAVNVRVDAYYRHPLFIPLISAILDRIDGTSDNALRIGASEEMRVENADILSNPGVSSCSS